jgi:hypothetical protein
MQFEIYDADSPPSCCGDMEAMTIDRFEKSEPGKSTATAKPFTCSHCNQSFKSEFDLVRSGNGTLCIACYESLIEPFPRLCCGSASF